MTHTQGSTPPASQSEALINVGPINRIPGSDSISCPGLPSGMMCFGWGEQGWAINDKDGKRVAAGNWGDRATLPASQSEALVDLIAHELAEWLEWKDAMEAATAMLRIAVDALEAFLDDGPCWDFGEWFEGRCKQANAALHQIKEQSNEQAD